MASCEKIEKIALQELSWLKSAGGSSSDDSQPQQSVNMPK